MNHRCARCMQWISVALCVTFSIATPRVRAQNVGAGQGTPSRTPVLVELFTSEGCSTCPPADDLLEDLIKRQPVPGVTIVGLGEHVDYWNQLGWTDRFSSSAYSQRQRVYARNMKASEVYTPQTVINGTREALGSDRAGREQPTDYIGQHGGIGGTHEVRRVQLLRDTGFDELLPRRCEFDLTRQPQRELIPRGRCGSRPLDEVPRHRS